MQMLLKYFAIRIIYWSLLLSLWKLVWIMCVLCVTMRLKYYFLLFSGGSRKWWRRSGVSQLFSCSLSQSLIVSHSFLCTSFGLHGLSSLLQSPMVSHSFRCSPLVSVVSPVSCSLLLSLTHLCVRPLVSMVSVVSSVSCSLSIIPL